MVLLTHVPEGGAQLEVGPWGQGLHLLHQVRQQREAGHLLHNTTHDASSEGRPCDVHREAPRPRLASTLGHHEKNNSREDEDFIVSVAFLWGVRESYTSVGYVRVFNEPYLCAPCRRYPRRVRTAGSHTASGRSASARTCITSTRNVRKCVHLKNQCLCDSLSLSSDFLPTHPLASMTSSMTVCVASLCGVLHRRQHVSDVTLPHGHGTNQVVPP